MERLRSSTQHGVFRIAYDRSVAWHLACSNRTPDGRLKQRLLRRSIAMKRWNTHWATAIAAAALFALPPSARAQSPASPQTPASAAAQQSPQPATPQDHLRQAESALDSISPTAVTGKAKSRIAELKQHLSALQRASASGTPSSDAKPAGAPSDSKWATEVAAMDRILTDLIGSDSTTGAVGTTGTSESKASDAVTIDDDTRGKLTEVRITSRRSRRPRAAARHLQRRPHLTRRRPLRQRLRQGNRRRPPRSRPHRRQRQRPRQRSLRPSDNRAADPGAASTARRAAESGRSAPAFDYGV